MGPVRSRAGEGRIKLAQFVAALAVLATVFPNLDFTPAVEYSHRNADFPNFLTPIPLQLPDRKPQATTPVSTSLPWKKCETNRKSNARSKCRLQLCVVRVLACAKNADSRRLHF